MKNNSWRGSKIYKLDEEVQVNTRTWRHIEQYPDDEEHRDANLYTDTNEQTMANAWGKDNQELMGAAGTGADHKQETH